MSTYYGPRLVVPAPAPESISSSIFGFFANRSFRRLVAILGIGSAVALAYSAYKKHLFPTESDLDISQEADINIPAAESEPERVKVNANAEEIEIPEEPPKYEKVILFQAPRGFFTPAVSPFGLRLETFLRAAKIDHEVRINSPSDEMAPWIKVGDEEIKNHTECIKYLSKKFNIELAADASSSRKTAARLVDTLFESKIAWGVALWRWVYDGGRSVKDIQALAPTNESVLSSIRDSVSRASSYQGIGKQSQEEVVTTVIQGLIDSTAALGKHQYFLGNSPGEVDCHAFSLLAQMVWNMSGSPFEKAINQQKPLMEFVIRMRDNCWPDWEELIHQGKQFSAASSGLSSLQDSTTTANANQNGDVQQQQEIESEKSLSRATTLPQSNPSKIQHQSAHQYPKSAMKHEVTFALSKPSIPSVLKASPTPPPQQQTLPKVPQQYIPPMQQLPKIQAPSYLQVPLAYGMAPPPQVFYPGVQNQNGQFGIPAGGRLDYMNPLPQTPVQYGYAKPMTRRDPTYYEDLQRATEAVLKPSTTSWRIQNESHTNYNWQ